MKHVKVELYCKAERTVIAEIETEGPLNEATLKNSTKVLDSRRMPMKEVLLDGVQLTCGACHEPLWFRSADEELVVAMVGMAKAVP